MENQTTAMLDRSFAALADPTRRAILLQLTQGEAGVMELAAPFEMSQPAVTRHIKVLTDAGLIKRRSQGTKRLCSLSSEGFENITPWLSMIADAYGAKYNQLDALLARMADGPT
ncbi:MAG: DNA-binding transcriptional ArsR family regulator [Paracoccaceae bacterium]|jgi:DNA-binding transcriptional ArsR family regulator